jgi:hypothetical protein
MRQAPDGDYARNVLCNCGARRPEIAWQINVPKAEFISTKLNKLRMLGVDIFPRATSETIQTNLFRYRVAIIVTHWKGYLVLPRDLLSADSVALGLVGGLGEELEFLRELLGFASIGAISSAITCGSVDEVASLVQTALNELIEEHDLDPSIFSPNRAARNRDYLSRLFHPHLCPGNGIELVDGVLDSSDFERLIPESYEGVVDLTVCNSVDLATHLMRTRRSTICLSSKDEATPDFRMSRITLTCEIMREKNLKYLEASRVSRDIVAARLISRKRRYRK